MRGLTPLIRSRLFIPLTRTGSSPTLGEQHLADCPNVGEFLLLSMWTVRGIKVVYSQLFIAPQGLSP